MGSTRLSPALRTLLGAAFVSYLGSGLTLPFLFIYLHSVRGIPTGITGLLISGTAVISLPTGPATGTLIDRFSPRAIAVSTMVVGVAATSSLVFVHSAVSALVPMLLFGVSMGSWAAWGALAAVMTTEAERPRVFALNFQLLNLGLGIGAVIAGSLVHVSHPSSFVTVYLADAASDLVVITALLALPVSAFRSTSSGSSGAAASDLSSEPPVDLPTELEQDSPGGYREVLADRRMMRYLIVAIVLGVAGYGAVSAGAVGYASTFLHVSTRSIAWAFAANTAFIVLFQPIGLRVSARMRRTRAMQLVALFFGSSWVVLLIAGMWPSTLAASLLVGVAFTIFAAGEVLLSPVAGPLVNDFATPRLIGRYNALSSFTFSAAEVISPAIAGPMLGASLGREYLGLLVFFCGAAAVGFAWLRRSLTDEQDRAPADRPATAAQVDGSPGEDLPDPVPIGSSA